MKPTFDELILNLTKNGKLNIHKTHCVEDFYKNYDAFVKSICSNEIIFIVSTQMLSKKLKKLEYSRYRIYSSQSIFYGIIGMFVLFFNIKGGSLILLLSFISLMFSLYLKKKTGLNFAMELKLKFALNPDEGMLKVCKYYLAGILQLHSVKGKAIAPMHPSYCLTGFYHHCKRT